MIFSIVVVVIDDEERDDKEHDDMTPIAVCLSSYCFGFLFRVASLPPVNDKGALQHHRSCYTEKRGVRTSARKFSSFSLFSEDLSFASFCFPHRHEDQQRGEEDTTSFEAIQHHQSQVQ